MHYAPHKTFKKGDHVIYLWGKGILREFYVEDVRLEDYIGSWGDYGRVGLIQGSIGRAFLETTGALFDSAEGIWMRL